jgi:two-component system, LytTR family, response regulator LytT
MKKAPAQISGDRTVSSIKANPVMEQEKKVQISFSIRLEDRMHFVLVENVACIYLDGTTVYLLDFKGEKHIISKTLEYLEHAIPSQQFYRISRQMIVNRQAIKEVETYANQRIVVHLTVPTPVQALVSRLKVKPFFNWIETG